MEDRYVKEYKGHALHFAPQRAKGQRFMAFLIVKPIGRPMQVMFAGTSEAGSFASCDDAAEAGLMAGLRWVDESISRQIRASQPFSSCQLNVLAVSRLAQT